MILLSDLKRFNTLLENKNTENIKILCIFKKLESWEPVKDYIIISNIGKTIFRISQLGGDIGLKASVIVKKWKKYLLPSPQKNKPKSKNIEKVKKTNSQSSISHTKEIKQTPKKNSLSLNDYYKRRGIETKENSHNQIDNKSTSSSSKDVELTSDLGISFMDSFTIRPNNQIKPKKKLLKNSEIRAITDHDKIINRNDIINQSNTKKDYEDENKDLTLKVEANLKYWQPKAPKYCSTAKQPESLLKLCQDCLLIYRANIEEVYLTPRELLLTVLDNYSPDQLLTFESFNPHYIIDNDELWRKHFISKFPERSKSHKESWRNVYLRSISEISEKFESSIRNMKRKYQDNKKNDEKHQVKIINSSYRHPEKRRFFLGRHETESIGYSSVTQKLIKQIRKDSAYFKF